MRDAIDYAPEPPPGLTRGVIRRLVAMAAAIALFLIVWWLLGTVAYQHNGWMCATCGSFRSQNDWTFGWTTSPTLRSTALDARISQHQGGHAHDWRHIVGTYSTVFGTNRGSGHGSAPAILGLNIGDPSLVDHFVRVSSDEEIAEFVRVMTHGTEREQRDAVDRAGDRALDALR